MLVSRQAGGKIIDLQTEKSKIVVQTLRETEILCTLISDSTRLPYVECDPDTCDDEILVFDSEEKAKEAAEALKESGYPVRVMNIPVKHRLGFFSNLFSMGVNAVLFQEGAETKVRLDLDKLITRPQLPGYSVEIGEQLRKGEHPQFRVENPAFHLTAIYFTQKARSREADRLEEEIKELQEEMMIHYREGYYLTAQAEDGGIPLIQIKDSGSLQPIFTDMQEFAKFQRANAGKKLRIAVASEAEFLKHVPKKATGIVVNPFGISLVLRVKHNG